MLTKDQLLHTALLAGLCFHTGASVYAAVFAKLMWTLYVDREPHEIFSPVQKSRIPPTIALDSLGLPPAKYINPYEGTKVEPPPAGFPDAVYGFGRSDSREALPTSEWSGQFHRRYCRRLVNCPRTFFS